MNRQHMATTVTASEAGATAARGTAKFTAAVMAAMAAVVVMAMLSTGASAAEGQPAGGERSLEEFGDIATVEQARAALEQGMAALMDEGGGVLVIPADAPKALRVPPPPQAGRFGHGVTVIDHREGFLTYHLPPFGQQVRERGLGSGNLTLHRELNLEDQNLGFWPRLTNLWTHNSLVKGSSSYSATLTDSVEAGEDRHLYVDTIRGIWVGQYLSITGERMGYGGARSRIEVKDIGWDPERQRNYFVADLDHDHPAGAMVYNKDMISGVRVSSSSNTDNQTAGELTVDRYVYGVGDTFGINVLTHYMSDIFSGFGDEGGVGVNIKTMGEINGFHSTVEAFDPDRDEVTYAPGKVNAHTLSHSRPLINMNEDKWITEGHVYIVRPADTFRGMSNPGRTGGPGNVFNYQGGLIMGSSDVPWTEEIVGRYFAVTDPTEVITPDDDSMMGGHPVHRRPPRPIYRWYRIMDLIEHENGTKTLRILRVRWSAVAAGAPNLFRDDNYSRDDYERPLSYAIAPGAWVYDIGEGWQEVRGRGGVTWEDRPRRLKVVPNGDRGTTFDFEPGDPIEQPPGPDPWHPRPLVIRQVDNMPTTMNNSTIEVYQMGRVQVPHGLTFTGHIRSSENLPRRKDRKPPYDRIINFDLLSNVGIEFGAEVMHAALLFRQPNGRPQPLRWTTEAGGSTLIVSPKTGDFRFSGGDLDAGAGSLRRVRGISAGSQSAINLRGINVSVSAGEDRLEVTFPDAEPDGNYSLTVQPSWFTLDRVVEKGPEGFVVRFSEPAPEDAAVDWQLIR